MKKLFYTLFALSLLLTACHEQEPLEYTFQDVRCLYAQEYSIAEETVQDNAVQVVFRKDADNQLWARIENMGSALSAQSDEDIVILVEQSAQDMLERNVLGDSAYSFSAEPYNQIVKPDRHSLERMIFESVWTYTGTKNGEPVYGTVAVKTVGNYLVSLFYEASSREEKDHLVDIDYSFKLK